LPGKKTDPGKNDFIVSNSAVSGCRQWCDLYSQSEVPRYIKRFAKTVGRGINEHAMIRENDRVLLGVSGGKDSLAMALALSLRRRWMPVTYELSAVMIEWKEFPLSTQQKEGLDAFFDGLSVPFRRVPATMEPPSFKDRFSCYLCARNRKRILFGIAEKEGFNKIAFGHHLDDMAETVMMNMAFRGQFASMMPRQSFFDGALEVIRPLCWVREEQLDFISRALNLPVVSIPCRLKETNVRTRLKPILRMLTGIDGQAREKIIRSLTKINSEYLPDG
jgi:tRNA 2-thiocytidine biosynthesis protein TtcA